MSEETKIAPPSGQGDPAPQADKPAEQQPQTAPKNEEVLTPEMREELRRNLNASKEEALRLKKENEELKKVTSAPAKTQIDETYQPSETELEVFERLLAAREAKRIQQEEARKAQEEKAFQESQMAYQVGQTEAINKFLEEYPEYNKPGDANSDQLWKELEDKVQELPLPRNPKDFQKLLVKAHQELMNKGDSALERGKALGFAQANLQEQAKLGGGSSGGSSAPTKKKRSPEQQAVLDELFELRPQYKD